MNTQPVLLKIAETTTEAVLACDLFGAVTYANPALAALGGWTAAHLEGMNCRELLADFPVLTSPAVPHDCAPHRLSLQEFSTSLRTPCGTMLPVTVTVAPIREGEVISGALLTVGDARSPEGLAQALRQTEATYRALVEHMLDGLVEYQIVLDAQGRPVDAIFCAANAAFESITGIARDAVVGRRVTEVRPEVDSEWLALLGQVALTGEAVRFERHSERMGKWFSMLAYCPREGHCAIVSEDISARKQAEEVARQRQQEIVTLLDSMPGYAFFKNQEGQYVTANEQFCRAVGCKREDIVGLSDRALFPAELADKYTADDRLVMATGQAIEVEEQMLDAERLLVVATRKVPLLDESGKATGLIGLGFDITDRKRSEDSQRLASIGQLAAGVAHEFNNLLAAMMMKAELAKFRDEPREYDELAQMVLRSSLRGAAICRNLAAFAGPRALDRVQLAISAPLEAALLAGRQQLADAGVEVRRLYQDRGAPVLGDPCQLEQVFLNIIINACHAMPEGGVLTVCTGRQESPLGPLVTVTISDTGTGIPPEHLPHVLEPFFTTKGLLGRSDTPGTGLGLSIAHGAVQAHGGRIEVHCEPGAGVVVAVELPEFVEPRVDTEVELGRQVGIAAASQRELRVLVAEDEAEVRRLVTQILADNGCLVTATATTAEALEALEVGTFDLVITDWLMPDGGGREVAASAKSRNDPPPIVVITGRIEPDVNEELLAAQVVRRLQKPFHVADLMAVVNQIRAEIQPR